MQTTPEPPYGAITDPAARGRFLDEVRRHHGVPRDERDPTTVVWRPSDRWGIRYVFESEYEVRVERLAQRGFTGALTSERVPVGYNPGTREYESTRRDPVSNAKRPLLPVVLEVAERLIPTS